MASLQFSINPDAMDDDSFVVDLDGLFSEADVGEDEWNLATMAMEAAFTTGFGSPPSDIDPRFLAQISDASMMEHQPFTMGVAAPPPQQEVMVTARAASRAAFRDINSDDDNQGDDDDDEVEAEAEPMASSLAAQNSEAAMKRARHREAMQRCRERKRSRMSTLEKEQRQMKLVLRQRLLEHLQHEQMEARSTRPSTVVEPPLNPVEELRKRFAAAVRLKEALLDERQALEQSMRDHQKFEKIVLQSRNQLANDPSAKLAPTIGSVGVGVGTNANTNTNANEFSPEDGSSSSSSGQETIGPDGAVRMRKPLAGRWVQHMEDEPPLFYEPEPEDAIHEHIRICYQRVRALQDGFDTKLINAQETHCLGWVAQHSLLRTPSGHFDLRFRFRRRVPLARMSLDDLQRNSWSVMKDPVRNARLYSALVVCKIVQVVGDNTFIFIRNAPDRDRRLHIRYFSMHSQMEYRSTQNERAYMTLMKILDKDPHIIDAPKGSPSEPPRMPVIWLKDGTLFMNFTEKLAENEIEIEYGGSVLCPSEDHARYLMVEVGGVLMRWENFVVPQRFLL